MSQRPLGRRSIQYFLIAKIVQQGFPPVRNMNPLRIQRVGGYNQTTFYTSDSRARTTVFYIWLVLNCRIVSFLKNGFHVLALLRSKATALLFYVIEDQEFVLLLPSAFSRFGRKLFAGKLSCCFHLIERGGGGVRPALQSYYSSSYICSAVGKIRDWVYK